MNQQSPPSNFILRANYVLKCSQIPHELHYLTIYRSLTKEGPLFCKPYSQTIFPAVLHTEKLAPVDKAAELYSDNQAHYIAILSKSSKGHVYMFMWVEKIANIWLPYTKIWENFKVP